MKTYFAYVRVSTTRQGEEGVSLQEQRAAILEYATKRGMSIAAWFEEQVSAAKRGRPVFNKLVALLKSKRAAGIIIHKIDRGARNLRDWADMAELMDRGIEVHFAHESIDLHTRSGRLSADILAVVAADYIRNLREETIKGINGRLKQGLFPFCAPVGYVNNGGGKVKTIDPVRGPLIRQAFELYGSRKYTIRKLEEELFTRGLRTRTGKRVCLNHLAMILRNPFYMGLIRIRNKKETFAGVHVPLITSALYNEVQLIIDGKKSYIRHHNQFLFRLLLKCEHCKLYLVGERKKGHVYYRCHRRACPVTCIREERFEEAVLDILRKIAITKEEDSVLKDALSKFKERDSEIASTFRRNFESQIDRIQRSIQELLQRFLDNTIPRETFDDGHTALLMERRSYEDKIANLDQDQGTLKQVEKFLNGLRSVQEQFLSRRPDVVQSVVNRVFASITTSGKTIRVTPSVVSMEIISRQRTKEHWLELLPVITRELVDNPYPSEILGSAFEIAMGIS